MFKGTLIRSGGDAKTTKGNGVYETAIMYLAPHDQAGINVCPMAVRAGCAKACLFTAGRGRMSNVQLARLNKTRRYAANRHNFMAELAENIEKFIRYCAKRGVKPAVRLNGTSDIQWEVGHSVTRLVDGAPVYAESIFEAFPEVQFYDYTKVTKRAYRKLPANYSLTLSYSEASREYASEVLQAARDTGLNVSVVYRTKEARDGLVGTTASVMEYAVVFDGDTTDLRFLDPTGVIVGLYAKGAAKLDQTGFVLN